VSISIDTWATMGDHADVAQLVERDLAKVEVAGSSPVVRSREFHRPGQEAGTSRCGDRSSSPDVSDRGRRAGTPEGPQNSSSGGAVDLNL
jgi:hypothetical protein